MEFAWTAAQKQFHDAVLRFAREKLNDDVLERDREHRFPAREWRLCGEFGVLGLCVPQEYGGMGLDHLTTALALEALGQGCEDMGLVFAIAAHQLAVAQPIAEAGSEELKRRVLPRLCSGEWVGSNAITEAEAGSDVFALKARAERVGDVYRVNGTKSYASNGPVADLFLVYASSTPDHGYLGIDAFVILRGAPGVTVGQPIPKMGLHTCPASSIYFEGVEVAAADRVGKEGGGAQIFTASMQWERSCLFAAYVGAMQRQLDLVAEYASQRKQGRRAIGRNQAVSHRIANMKLRLESARLLLYRACWMLDQGEDATVEVSMAKLAVSEAAVQGAIDAVQVFGAVGYSTESRIERMLRDAIPSTIFSGTSEIQRNLIAARLGL
ncbi:MAG TPA: acyl-CoA dehydrogenase family protein [Kofleriaceae bacterium]|nr:acyl-CoA dehydrogenase family protein [Kofleriaceae bacterium]